jgi:hypothetical protein
MPPRPTPVPSAEVGNSRGYRPGVGEIVASISGG